MRIVAGKYRRRKLLTNPGLTTRPITDRVKVILFERIQAQLDGVRVLDLFAGTGTLGLESLSRGAERVVFLEQDYRAHSLLVENVKTLGVENETLCWRTDAFRSSFRPKGVEGFYPYDVIFFDPPYKLTTGIQPGSLLYAALERLSSVHVSAPEALLILRCARGAEFALPPAWGAEQCLEINSMDLHMYRKSLTAVAEPSLPAPLDE